MENSDELKKKLPKNPEVGRPFYKMPFPAQTKEKVKRDFIVGMDIEDIQAKYHINDKMTIYNWANKGKWKEIRDLTLGKAKEKFSEQMSDWMLQQAKLGKFMQSKGKKALEYKDPEKIKVFEATDMIRTGAAMERQALKPDDDTKNKTQNVVIFLPSIEEQPQMKTINVTPKEIEE